MTENNTLYDSTTKIDREVEKMNQKYESAIKEIDKILGKISCENMKRKYESVIKEIDRTLGINVGTKEVKIVTYKDALHTAKKVLEKID